ncbi:MAG: GAF domain-containing protein [Acidimicrobiia bacterium]|nr:GAF domain-containing protein [Acidimicrobiia bacterium]
MVFRRRKDDEERAGSDEAAVIENLDRVSALYATGLMETGPRPDLDAVARTAAERLGTPVGLMTLVDARRQYFIGHYDSREDTDAERETPLDVSYCKHVVARDAPLEVRDAKTDPVVRNNPVSQDGSVRSYLGVPLRTAEGHTIGSFCVVDDVPREWTTADRTQLEHLAESAMATALS